MTAKSPTFLIKRAFAETSRGQIHYRSAGNGEPILMLHQTPRSSDEFVDVMPIFAKHHFRSIAMDTLGYGDSYIPLRNNTTIQDFASVAIELLDSLGIERAHIVGHHTGAVIAIEIASQYPERVEKLVLSAAPYVNVERRNKIMNRPSVDKVEIKHDGSHLTELWRIRTSFYPKNRPDLLARFVLDALKAKENMELGHHIVASYSVPERLSLIRASTLVMCGTEDPYSYPDLWKIANGIERSKVVEVKGGMVPIVDQMPEEFSKHVTSFLSNKI